MTIDPERGLQADPDNYFCYSTARYPAPPAQNPRSWAKSTPSLSIEIRPSPADFDGYLPISGTFGMNTLFLLMAQYNGRAIVPIETVCKDYFAHLTLPKFLRKVSLGEIELLLTRAEKSQKSARGVHLQDLADYLDKRRKVALYEARAFKEAHASEGA